MVELNLGISGAKRTSYKEYNLRDLCLKVQADNPKCDDVDQLRDLLIVEIKKEPGYIDTAVEYAASRTVNNTFNKPVKKSAEDVKDEAEAKGKAKSEAKAETKAETKTKLKDHIQKEAKIILLDLTMPNGKALRDCTGADCRKAGGWFAKIADKIGRAKVGAALSEKQLCSLYNKR